MWTRTYRHHKCTDILILSDPVDVIRYPSTLTTFPSIIVGLEKFITLSNRYLAGLNEGGS